MIKLDTRCSEEVTCPDDIIRPCIRPAEHDGWHYGNAEMQDRTETEADL